MNKPALLAVAALCAPVFVAGCGNDDGGAARIVDASLTDWQETGFVAVGGVVTGSASLLTTDENGESKSSDIGFGGPVVGVIFDIHTTSEADCGGATLSIPDGGVSEDELFESYTGSGAQVGMVLGMTSHELENGAGVKLKVGGVSVGVGMYGGFEWLGLSRD